MTNDLLKSTIEHFWDVIPSTWGNVRSKARSNAIQDHHLTLIQFHMLRHIRKGFCTVAELADMQHISRPAVSQAVDQLVRKDLVTRLTDPSDRRYVKLSLTSQGDQLLDAVSSKTRDWMAGQMASLNPQELQTINQALDILAKTLQNIKD